MRDLDIQRPCQFPAASSSGVYDPLGAPPVLEQGLPAPRIARVAQLGFGGPVGAEVPEALAQRLAIGR